MKSIKTCFIAPKTYPLFNPSVDAHFGGANVDLYYLSTELAKDDRFKVSFITADYGQARKECHENVQVIKSVKLGQNFLLSIWKFWNSLRYADADIYVFKTASPAAALIALFCILYRRKFVHRTAHQEESDGTYLKKHRFLGKTFVWALKKAALVFTQNAIDRQNLEHNLGIRAIDIPNGHRIPQWIQQEREFILWVGRTVDFKCPDLFLKLARTFPKEKFIIICQQATGDNAYKLLLEEAAQISNLEFIKSVPFIKIFSYFQKAKVFVNTSIAEGFPNTFIQACQYATPILSFRVNPDNFLEKYNCGYCANGNWEKMIEYLTKILQKDENEKLGINARKYVERRHDITTIAKHYKKYFAQLKGHKFYSR